MNPDIIILYNSKTGFTRRYAELAARELDCAVFPLADAPSSLSQYRAVAFGSRLHAGTVDGWKKAQKLLEARGAKRLALFATGAMPCQALAQIQTVWEQNLTPEERERIPHFYLQGGLCYEKMGGVDRAMMKFAAWAMSRKRNKTSEDQAFLEAISHSYDSFDPACAQPLLDCLRALSK